jgi:hypothetical protein
MTRDEHVEWCKQRAREYLDRGDAKNAITSMASDFEKHPETKGSAPWMAPIMLAAATDGTIGAARRFVEGFI